MARQLRAGIEGYDYMGEIRCQNINEHEALQLVGVADLSPAAKLSSDVKRCSSVEGLTVARRRRLATRARN